MRLDTTNLAGFAVVERLTAEAHARISEVPTPPPAPNRGVVASTFTRNSEAPGAGLPG